MVDSHRYYLKGKEYKKAGKIAIFISRTLYFMGFLDLARKLIQITIDTTKGTIKADALSQLGNICFDLGKIESAMKYLEYSLKISEELNYKEGKAGIIQQYGNMNFKKVILRKH